MAVLIESPDEEEEEESLLINLSNSGWGTSGMPFGRDKSIGEFLPSEPDWDMCGCFLFGDTLNSDGVRLILGEGIQFFRFSCGLIMGGGKGLACVGIGSPANGGVGTGGKGLPTGILTLLRGGEATGLCIGLLGTGSGIGPLLAAPNGLGGVAAAELF